VLENEEDTIIIELPPILPVFMLLIIVMCPPGIRDMPSPFPSIIIYFTSVRMDLAFRTKDPIPQESETPSEQN
jgi:hypothetical protein